VFVEGQKLVVGATVAVGDAIDVIVGRTPVAISLVGVRTVPAESDLAAANDTEALDDLKRGLSRALLEQLNAPHLGLRSLDSTELRESARLKLRKLLDEADIPSSWADCKDDIEQQIFDEVMGLGPLERLLADPDITEIMVNRRDQIFLERSGQLRLSAVNFSSDQALLSVIERIVSTVGRRIDASSPIVDARLLDGSRVNAVIPPLALRGPCLTIRRFAKTPISAAQLVAWGSLSDAMARFLQLVVRERKNVMISGGTGSGKTTLLNALSRFIPDEERIVTIEDAAELQLQQSHVISLETRPPNLEGAGAVTIRDLVRNTLRMRPDRIIVGECRGAEAIDMLQAMNTGHDGSMTTAHANTPEDMLRRLETMVMMAGMELPLRAIREQIAAALKIVVQQSRRRSGTRCVTAIAWLKDFDRATGDYLVLPLFSRGRTEEVHMHRENLAAFCANEELPADCRSAFLEEGHP
jgi:pilus assembly protein CpaF